MTSIAAFPSDYSENETDQIITARARSHYRKGVQSNICKPFEKSVKTVQKVTQRQQLQPDWWDVIGRIDRLEKFLGHPPGLLDLYFVGFRKEEIDIAQELLPSLFKSESEIMMECSDSESEPFHLSLLSDKAGRGLV